MVSNGNGVNVSLQDTPKIPVWSMDWACPACRRYGAIQVQVTGGGLDEKTRKPRPITTDEEFQRLLWEAHREATSGLCTRAVKYLMVGRLWRWLRTMKGKRMIIMSQTGAPPPASYRWPPWVE